MNVEGQGYDTLSDTIRYDMKPRPEARFSSAFLMAAASPTLDDDLATLTTVIETLPAGCLTGARTGPIAQHLIPESDVDGKEVWPAGEDGQGTLKIMALVSRDVLGMSVSCSFPASSGPSPTPVRR
uniref:Uncharacterized protein n=1 Tax=Mycena chlorophos TaxID=658473 RepID=A0ABQ0M1K1_MYCCL|nr:predicted protein [Mycena chlorophos]